MAIQSKTRGKEDGRVTVSYSDSINLIKKQVKWSPKGVSLLTKWPFQVGAEVEFAFDHEGERHCCTGVVVACRPKKEPIGFYDTVLYFVETPCSALQKAASECQLAREQLDGQGKAALPDEPTVNGSAHDGTGAKVRSAQSRR